MALNRYQPFFGFHDFPTFRLLNNEDPFADLLMPVVPRFTQNDDMFLRHSSPGYEIHETENEYTIAVDVPGIKAADMTVDLENGGKVLKIAGGRKVVREGGTSETKFEKRFTIGSNIDANELKANLADGVLVLKTPKRKEENHVRKIAITEGPVEEKKEA